MQPIHTLIELLKSQLAVYHEVLNILSEEKEALVAWKFHDTNLIAKRKEQIVHKEHILEEARKSLTDRIKNELSAKDTTLSSIISACADEDLKDKLIKLKDEFITVVQAIDKENMSLKILYSTNIKIVNDLYSQLGLLSSTSYDNSKKSHTPASIQTMG